jgi:hypothetical protein
VPCAAAEWRRFHDLSLEATIFTGEAFLASAGRPPTYWLIHQGEAPVAGYAFAAQEDDLVPLLFQQYSGPVFADMTQLKPVTRNQIAFEVMETLADRLFASYRAVSLDMHWSVLDIRPFQWLNYHAPEKGGYDTAIRFTSLLDISAPHDTGGWRKTRRSCLNKAERFAIETAITTEIEELNRLHDMTFARQGISRPPQEEVQLRAICRQLLAAGQGLLVIGRLDGVPASAAFFGYDSRRAYYLFGATDPEARTTEIGTRVLRDAFIHLRERLGLCEVDLVGVNSPQRGSFKLSFGGRLVPYFAVEKRPAAA